MRGAVLGPPGAGKSALMEVLTGVSRGVGVAKIPDPRLHELGRVLESSRLSPVSLTLSEESLSRGVERPGQLFNRLAGYDFLILVSREDPGEIMEILLLADLEALEGHLTRLRKEAAAGRASAPLELLGRARGLLQEGKPLASNMSREELGALAGYGYLTAKPTLGVMNQEEGKPSVPGITAPLDLHQELAQMEPEEAREVAREMGLGDLREALLPQVLRAAGRITFFTGMPGQELRAWDLPAGSRALEAAGRIHTDMAQGFIRAEVALWRDLVEAGGLGEARSRGLIKTVGRDHPIGDGTWLRVHFK